MPVDAGLGSCLFSWLLVSRRLQLPYSVMNRRGPRPAPPWGRRTAPPTSPLSSLCPQLSPAGNCMKTASPPASQPSPRPTASVLSVPFCFLPGCVHLRIQSHEASRSGPKSPGKSGCSDNRKYKTEVRRGPGVGLHAPEQRAPRLLVLLGWCSTALTCSPAPRRVTA